MDDAITLKPIGYVASPVEETVDEKWGEVVSRVVLLAEYKGGFDGLEGFSHVMI